MIRENLRLTGFESQGSVLCMPVTRALSKLQGPFSLALADPPYADASALPFLREFAASALVAAETVVVLERSAREEPAGEIGELSMINTRRHGDSAVSIYARR
jgi:16S rRNA G966 N2-methylase RsmD